MKAFVKFAGWTLLALLVVAVGLFLIVRRGDLNYADLRAKYSTPGDRYMELPGDVHLRYRDQGNAKAPVTLVLVHGFAASLADWEPWVQRLGGHYRIISLDLPGHGLTLAPPGYHTNTDGFADIVAEVIARLGVKRFVVVGNSMGGGVAWDLALRHPSRLDGLVLVDAVGPPPPGQAKEPGSGPIVFQLLRYPIFRGILSQIDLSPLVSQGLKSAFVDPRLVTPALAARYADFSRAPGHRSILLGLQSGERMGPQAMIARLGTIKAPTLVMAGEADHVIPFANGQELARAIHGSTFIAYPGVGHVPMEQIPDQSASDLDGWLKDKVAPKT
jgi:pimeloyl-ACP methyl ester carboxylesterase